MEVVTIESEAFKTIMFNIERNRKLTEQIEAKLIALKDDRWMSPEEVTEYTGFKYTWIYERRNKIGCFRDGKGLRFKKSNVDKYMEAHSFKIK